MSSDRRQEQELPGLLDDLYLGPRPAYLDHVLQQTARIRQRPAWTFLERWLPMVDIARQPVLAPRLPMRAIGMALILIAVLVAALAAALVATQPRLPLPFGIARNGLVAYAADGDIHAVDPTTGASTAIVRGPETDVGPRFSRDGTRLVFERKASGSRGPGLLFVVGANGKGLTQVTPAPAIRQAYQFSPDGSEIMFTSVVDGTSSISIAKSDGSGNVRTLDLGMPAVDPSYRPPDGAEILFANGDLSLHAVDVRTGVVRMIVGSSEGRSRGLAKWSPDGSQVSYSDWGDSSSWTVRVRVVAADGTGDRLLPTHPDAVWESALAWSNDGTRLVALRGYTGAGGVGRVVVVPVDGSAIGVELDEAAIAHAEDCPSWEWAPDDSAILTAPAGALGENRTPVIFDPDAGTPRAAFWTTASCPTWQRLAP